MSDLVGHLRALDLSITELEGDEWCDEADRALHEAANELERLKGVLLAIAKEARSAVLLSRRQN
jgi:hypothetical protein